MRYEHVLLLFSLVSFLTQSQFKFAQAEDDRNAFEGVTGTIASSIMQLGDDGSKDVPERMTSFCNLLQVVATSHEPSALAAMLGNKDLAGVLGALLHKGQDLYVQCSPVDATAAQQW